MVANTGVTPAASADSRPAERVAASLGAAPDIEVAEAADEPQPSLRRTSFSRAPRVTHRPLVLMQGGQSSRPYF